MLSIQKVALYSGIVFILVSLAGGAAYLVLACVGMFSLMLLGMVPIGGYDVWLHLGLAVGLAGAGFYASWFAPQLEQG